MPDLFIYRNVRADPDTAVWRNVYEAVNAIVFHGSVGIIRHEVIQGIGRPVRNSTGGQTFRSVISNVVMQTLDEHIDQ